MIGMWDVFGGLMHLNLMDGPVPIAVYGLAAVVLLTLAFTSSPRRWAWSGVWAVCGAVVGWVISWLVSDVWNSFDLTLSLPTRLWFTVSLAAAAVAIGSFYRRARWRKILAATAIPLFLLAGGIGINADIGEFPVVGDIFGGSAIHALILPSLEGVASTKWVPPVDMPTRGQVGAVVIPATQSHFAARKAVVYLPPAALVANAPALPVLVMLAGQPGQPSNVITAGQLPLLANNYTKQHHGLAPIVVMPDQLGAPANNPMCVDSPLGNSASYLTVDVPNWIHSHLRVRSGQAAWAIGGFSQGGTCSIQLGAKYPHIYGNIVDISGQVIPHRGSTAATVHDAFGGSTARYEAAAPLSLLAAGAPYPKTLAIFGVGAGDAKYMPAAATVAHGAQAAGMDVHLFVSPGTAHDWHTVQYSLRKAFPLLGARWGLK
ncbi:MAG: alpha/beta hydrolase-fold protein [Lacisediminihabitans sp.]